MQWKNDLSKSLCVFSHETFSATCDIKISSFFLHPYTRYQSWVQLDNIIMVFNHQISENFNKNHKTFLVGSSRIVNNVDGCFKVFEFLFLAYNQFGWIFLYGWWSPLELHHKTEKKKTKTFVTSRSWYWLLGLLTSVTKPLSHDQLHCVVHS